MSTSLTFHDVIACSQLDNDDPDNFRSHSHQAQSVTQPPELQKEQVEDIKGQSNTAKYIMGGFAGAAITVALIVVGFPPRGFPAAPK